MRSTVRLLVLAAALAAIPHVPAAAQEGGSVTADLLNDIGQVEKKMLDLARAIPEDKYGWRPGEGVRSIGEVLKHIAADNYLIPAALGRPIDAASGVTADFNTAVAFERRTMTKAAAIAELEKSFAYLRKNLGAVTTAQLPEKTTMFGQPFTNQSAWILATTHLHEHLGQLIAYARSNGVKPPWSS